MCATLLWRQERGVHCRVTACWICLLGRLSLASSLSEALDKIKLLDFVTTGCLVVWLRLWQPWHIFSTSLNWTDDAWYSRFVTVSTISSDISQGCNNQDLLLRRLISCRHSRWLSNAELEETSSLCNTTLWLKLSPKFEKWDIVSSSKWGPSKKRMADIDLFLVTTLSLSRFSLQTKQLARWTEQEK